jgi:hypothetical protein
MKKDALPITAYDKRKAAFSTICERIANGESLGSICREKGMPDKSTVIRWLMAEEEGGEFRNQYARAREMQAELLADELMDIADDGSNDWMARNDGENIGYLVNSEHIQRSKLRIDTRKWAASKLKPKVYGDKVQQEVTGGLTLRIERGEPTE